MPSFADDIVLAILALLLFGPKKLPVLARELGKWVAEFRRASNEFKYQMEEELRQSEQAERQKQIAAMEAAAPAAPAIASESAVGENSIHGGSTSSASSTETVHPDPANAPSAYDAYPVEEPPAPSQVVTDSAVEAANVVAEPAAASPQPLPIASSGSLNMMPPDTGLPVSRGANGSSTVQDLTPAPKEENAHAD